MSHPNTAFAFKDDDVPASALSPGIELLVEEIGSALAGGQVAYAALQNAKRDGDNAAIRSAATRLLAALVCDPKALARKIALLVKS